MKRLFVFSLTVSLLILSIIYPSVARADELVIQDDGDMVLLPTDNEILGISAPPTQAVNIPQPTSKPVPPQRQNTSQMQQQSPKSSPNPVVSVPVKTVPLVPPHTQSTVQINPSTEKEKKVQVVITTQSISQPSQTPSLPQLVNTAGTHSYVQTVVQPTMPQSSQIKNTQTGNSAITISSSIVSPTPLPSVMMKTVDQVVAQDSNGRPVITIKSNKTHQLTIQQGSTQVSTTLPLEIDTLTNTLSVSSQNHSEPINVLPSEAIQGIIDNGVITSKNAKQAKIHLTKDSNGINYTVSTNKQGKLFGIYSVYSKVQIKLSAQNGKIVQTAQSFLFNIFGRFIY